MIDYRPGSTLKAPHFLIAPPTAAILERRLQINHYGDEVLKVYEV